MEFLFGHHAVEAVLQRRRRQAKKLYLAAKSELTSWQQLLHPKTEVIFSSPQQLADLCQSTQHQGVVLETTPYPYVDIKELSELERGWLAVLDQITDPMNLGAILRSAAALGAGGVVLPKHNSAGVTPVVQRVAVGASEWLKIANCTNLDSFLRQMKDHGFWAVGTVSDGGEPLEKFKFPDKTLLVLGSEEKGIRPLLRKQCDFLVSLPLRPPIESLNVSVAFALFAYQLKLQAEKT